MHPDACHWPLMLSTIQSVYWMPPAQPGGVTSGHEFCRLNSTCAPLGIRSSRVSVAAAGQFGTSVGELWMITEFMLIASFGAGAVGGDGGRGEKAGAGSGSIWNACVTDHGPRVVGS